MGHAIKWNLLYSGVEKNITSFNSLASDSIHSVSCIFAHKENNKNPRGAQKTIELPDSMKIAIINSELGMNYTNPDLCEKIKAV